MDTKTQQTGQHTPGPWIADGTTVMTSDGIYLHVATTHFLTDRPEANARLIAAAPEMYEGIGDFLAAYDRARIGDWDHGKLIDWLGEQVARLRFVYAKAEGR